MKVLTWYKLNKKKNSYEYNHFAEYKENIETPTIKFKSQNSWKNETWKSKIGTLTNNVIKD